MVLVFQWGEVYLHRYRMLSCGSGLKMYQLFDLFLRADDKKDKVSSAVAKTIKSEPALKAPTTPTKGSKTSPATAAPPTTTTSTTTSTPAAAAATGAAAPSAPTTPLGVNLEKVDLGKISSILSSLTSAMKSTGMVDELKPKKKFT